MNAKLKIELLLVAMTVIIVVMVMYPIYEGFGHKYPFYKSNILAILLFTTFTRFIFLLKYTYWSKSVLVKFLLIVACIPLFYYFLDSFYNFTSFDNEVGVFNATLGNDLVSRINYAKYARVEYIFFCVGTLILCVLFPLRMIISVWRVRNRGTV